MVINHCVKFNYLAIVGVVLMGTNIIGNCPSCGRIYGWTCDGECLKCGNFAHIYSKAKAKKEGFVSKGVYEPYEPPKKDFVEKMLIGFVWAIIASFLAIWIYVISKMMGY